MIACRAGRSVVWRIAAMDSDNSLSSRIHNHFCCLVNAIHEYSGKELAKVKGAEAGELLAASTA